MDIEEIACSLLRQTKIKDKELHSWVSLLANDRGFEEEFRDWQVSKLSKFHERVSVACYHLACQVIWFRKEGRFDDRTLSIEIANFHHRITEANKLALKRANYLRFLGCRH
jgi:hypothetical protein